MGEAVVYVGGKDLVPEGAAFERRLKDAPQKHPLVGVSLSPWAAGALSGERAGTRFSAGGFCGVREALSSQGPYHLSRELALLRAVVCSTWRPPNLLGFERMSIPYGACGTAQLDLP
jgi:hypothetical protein